MNIYGDKGNIITLVQRCKWRGIDVKVEDVNTHKDFAKIKKGDLFFFGGGQDHDQMLVNDIIDSDRAAFIALILNAVDAKKVFLLVCGGYQLFGKHFVDGAGNAIPGLGILDIETKSAGPETKERCIGNIVIRTNLPIKPTTLIGFENHGGQTVLSSSVKPLGKVIVGHGNNLTSSYEGCHDDNIFGCYLHGSLLPKNPHFADYLIRLSLEQKYGEMVELEKLDDRLEMETRERMVTALIS